MVGALARQIDSQVVPILDVVVSDVQINVDSCRLNFRRAIPVRTSHLNGVSLGDLIAWVNPRPVATVPFPPIAAFPNESRTSSIRGKYSFAGRLTLRNSVTRLRKSSNTGDERTLNRH
jgi:hypothetical protein